MTKWPGLNCLTLRCCQAIRRSLRSCISNTMIYNIAGFMMFYLWIQLHQTSNSEESSCHCLSLLKWPKWIQMDAREARDFSFRDVVWHDIHILYMYYIYIYIYIYIYYIYTVYIQYIYILYVIILCIYIYYTVYIYNIHTVTCIPSPNKNWTSLKLELQWMRLVMKETSKSQLGLLGFASLQHPK
jgi:hypothetical protein